MPGVQSRACEKRSGCRTSVRFMPILEIHGKPIHRGIEAHVSAWTTALVYVSRILSGAFRGFHCSGVFAQASANTRVRIHLGGHMSISGTHNGCIKHYECINHLHDIRPRHWGLDS